MVIDGGLLEHVFDFPTAIRNCMRMVRQGGHLILNLPVNNFPGHGFYRFSPELVFRVPGAARWVSHPGRARQGGTSAVARLVPRDGSRRPRATSAIPEQVASGDARRGRTDRARTRNSTHHRSRATTPSCGRSLQLHRRIQSRASWLRPHRPHPLVAPHRAAPPGSGPATDHLSRQGEDAPRLKRAAVKAKRTVRRRGRPRSKAGYRLRVWMVWAIPPLGKPPSLFRFQTRIRAGPRSVDRSGATRPASRPPHERGHARSLRKTVATPALWKGGCTPLYGGALCRWSQTSASISRCQKTGSTFIHSTLSDLFGAQVVYAEAQSPARRKPLQVRLRFSRTCGTRTSTSSYGCQGEGGLRRRLTNRRLQAARRQLPEVGPLLREVTEADPPLARLLLGTALAREIQQMARRDARPRARRSDRPGLRGDPDTTCRRLRDVPLLQSVHLRRARRPRLRDRTGPHDGRVLELSSPRR